jgi:hypothetical protein
MVNPQTEKFWNWFVHNEKQLRSADGERVSNQILGQLALYDERLGVEVSQVSDFSGRELIFTAFGDSAAFDSAKELTQRAPTCEGWNIFCLKPPQGFEFVITLGDLRIQAANLSFEPLKSAKDPKTLGIRILVPGKFIHSQHVFNAIMMVIQTGVGEQLFADIGYVDVFPQMGTADELLSIQELAEYIEWHKKRNSQ